ncbi:hypothetical protein FHT87_005170 [Rhizobium sp. BK316]|uniref:hypothetical protein n=1 Tax=Rhizobium sp. BK316 TaxID=2587053 RepID=UPI00161F6CC3|nr:hypothetical protein [Rhizobium sp. BK316]MBB3411217.1 hypothetical protein [Rhizobium sp. BK316]
MTASHLDVRLLTRARQQINELIDSRTEAVASGMAEDHAAYKQRCGEIQGMRMALEVMEEIVRQMGESRL